MANQDCSLVFKKFFTAGNLVGLTSSPQYLGFVSPARRSVWLKGVREHAERNGWILEEVMFYPGSMTREECLEDYTIWVD